MLNSSTRPAISSFLPIRLRVRPSFLEGTGTAAGELCGRVSGRVLRAILLSVMAEGRTGAECRVLPAMLSPRCECGKRRMGMLECPLRRNFYRPGASAMGDIAPTNAWAA